MVNDSNQHFTQQSQRSRPSFGETLFATKFHVRSSEWNGAIRPASGNQSNLQVHDIGQCRTGDQKVIGGEQKVIRIVSR